MRIEKQTRNDSEAAYLKPCDYAKQVQITVWLGYSIWMTIHMQEMINQISNVKEWLHEQKTVAARQQKSGKHWFS